MEVHAEELKDTTEYQIVDRFDDDASPVTGKFVLLYKEQGNDESERAIFTVDGKYVSFDPVMNKFMAAQAGGKRKTRRNKNKQKHSRRR
jgi:hypothetical protein